MECNFGQPFLEQKKSAPTETSLSTLVEVISMKEDKTAVGLREKFETILRQKQYPNLRSEKNLKEGLDTHREGIAIRSPIFKPSARLFVLWICSTGTPYCWDNLNNVSPFLTV
jgi:hypothetical protein